MPEAENNALELIDFGLGYKSAVNFGNELIESRRQLDLLLKRNQINKNFYEAFVKNAEKYFSILDELNADIDNSKIPLKQVGDNYFPILDNLKEGIQALCTIQYGIKHEESKN